MNMAKNRKEKTNKNIFMRKKKEVISLLIYGFLVTALISCAPSYPKGKVLESIIKTCKEKYDLEVEAKIEGETLGVCIVLDNLIGENFLFDKQARGKMDRVFLTVTRVSLSTDAPLIFFRITCKDPVSQMEISFTRYVADIKKYISGYMAQEDYFNRLVLELIPQNFWDKDSFSLSEIDLPSFLAAQIVQRLNNQINQKNISVPGFYIDVVDKEEEDNELITFRCRLEVEENMDSSEYMWDDFLELLMETVDNVCYKYDFSDYEALQLLEADGEEIIIIKKASLENMQKQKKKWVFK